MVRVYLVLTCISTPDSTETNGNGKLSDFWQTTKVNSIHHRGSGAKCFPRSVNFKDLKVPGSVLRRGKVRAEVFGICFFLFTWDCSNPS
jgi:hypothetical protein